jgi:hypothetical protein
MNGTNFHTDSDEAVIAWLVNEALRPGSRFHVDLFETIAPTAQGEGECDSIEAILDSAFDFGREVA